MDILVTGPPDSDNSGLLSGRTAVVIDILRATSTMVAALENGAARIVPFEHPEDALEFKRRSPGSLAGGERSARPLPGFDLGNSPLEYTPERVAGRAVALCSTNGTRAAAWACRAQASAAGAFVNLEALVSWIQGRKLPVVLVCAGQQGETSPEDDAFAGCLMEALGARPKEERARWCLEQWRSAGRNPRRLVTEAPHGKYLASLGYHQDLEWCSRLSVSGCVPRWDASQSALIPQGG